MQFEARLAGGERVLLLIAVFFLGQLGIGTLDFLDLLGDLGETLLPTIDWILGEKKNFTKMNSFTEEFSMRHIGG